MSIRPVLLMPLAFLVLTGCANHHSAFHGDGLLNPTHIAETWETSLYGPDAIGPPGHLTDPDVHNTENVAWGEPTILPAGLDQGPQIVADSDGPYLLDSGDQLRVFVYAQPNLSRLYTVGHNGKITIPLIGSVRARGRTPGQVQATIRELLSRDFVRDPQVTVDIQQARPFYILGQVNNAGQFPYQPGMTVETAVAIAGGYTERASSRVFRITRRINGLVEQIEAPSDYVVKAGDTVFVFERYF